MIEQDTVRLLRECDAGIKMGTASIGDVLPHVKGTALRQYLEDCRTKHEKLGAEIQGMLERYHDEGKAPNAMAKGMSWMKTNVKLAVDDSDETIVDLMTDGCNMGVKSLNRYLNEYEAAEERAKGIAKRLVNLEEKLVTDIRGFL